MPFDLDMKGCVALHDAKLEVAERYIGYDGTKSKPKYGKMLVLTIILED